MHTTPVSLLERLRLPGEEHAWTRFVDMYGPLLYGWACRMGLQEQDAVDLVQELFAVLVVKLPDFHYDQHKSFRGWLRTILYNKWRDHRRRRAPEARWEQAVDIPQEEPEAFWEIDYRQALVGRALELMQQEFQPKTWQACWEMVVSDRSAADIAAELGMTVDAVYTAKSRVLRRLRKELDGLLD